MNRDRAFARLRPAVACIALPAVLIVICLSPMEPAFAVDPGGRDGAGPPALDRSTRAAIVDSVSATLLDQYVFADTARHMADLIRGKLARGEYDRLVAPEEFARQLTEDLQSISKDRHLRAIVAPAGETTDAPPPSIEEMEKKRLAEAALHNFGFERLEVLEGNVGYVDLRSFIDAKYAGETAVAAMNFLSHCDALIFDVRKNGGGDPTMIQLLAGYLFEDPTHLNSFSIRKGDRTEQFWSYASVPGRKLTDLPVYVLTSHFTFSCAEEFTYDLQSLKRGTVVGEVTGGGAHPVNGHLFSGLPVGLMVPFGRAVNPITGKNWEGTGVHPDIETTADDALTTAHHEALRVVMAKTQDPDRKRSLEWALAGLDYRAHAPVVDRGAMRQYVGTYGPRKVTLENGNLYYQREGGPRRRLVPGDRDLFLVDDVAYFRVRFARDDRGRIEKLIGLYDDGHSDENPRTAG